MSNWSYRVMKLEIQSVTASFSIRLHDFVGLPAMGPTSEEIERVKEQLLGTYHSLIFFNHM